MRTLCKAFICLCLFASLSFANEIPLILEETIQLPQATPYWDVMPHWNHSYYWMTSIGTSDSSTVIYWGDSNTNGYDSLFLEDIGTPTFISGFFDSLYAPCIVISALRVYGTEYETSDTCTVELLRVTDGQEITPQRHWIGSSYNTGYTSSESGKHRLINVMLNPSPPQATQSISAVLTKHHSSYHHNSGSSSSESGWIITDLLFDGGFDSTSTEFLSYASGSMWADYSTLITWGITEYSNYPTPYTNYNMYVHSWNMSDNPSIEFSLPTLSCGAAWYEYTGVLRLFACINDIDCQTPLAIMKWGGVQLSGISMTTGETEWEIADSSTNYEMICPAYVLFGNGSEQILAYDPEQELFDIIKIEDGSIWGQTSELPNDFDEMKIIGRYHNDYRRLAVRYDDEIQIYSFGTDPNYIPPLPRSYTLSVYPNPFNPSTTISFSLPVYEQARLSIFNTLGREVQVLTNELLSPGKYSYTFDASDLPSGIFFAHLSAGSIHSTKKLVLLK